MVFKIHDEEWIDEFCVYDGDTFYKKNDHNLTIPEDYVGKILENCSELNVRYFSHYDNDINVFIPYFFVEEEFNKIDNSMYFI